MTIHLGDFHAMMFFSVIGNYLEGSGFQEIVFQTKMCTSGSIKAVMKGKHYNMCWMIHEAFAECIEKLLMEGFINTKRPKLEHPSDSIDYLDDEEIKSYISQRERLLDNYTEAKLGKTGKYWMMYCWLVDLLHKFHYAVNQNDYHLRLAVWQEMLPFCFVFNKVHYARYGTFYVNQLKQLEVTHPGAKGEIEEFGLSVRRNEFTIGQAVGLAGEQTFMKSAKTACGIIKFVNSEECIAKWVLNRQYQSMFTEALQDMTNTSKIMLNPLKSTQQRDILKSTTNVKKMKDAILSYFLNPFDPELQKDSLYHLVSSSPLDEYISTSLL